jgi:membrane-anchored glycerophosphoryl diester phosphodiesterase (GDPDase)
MSLPEIILIVIIVLFVLFIFGKEVYNHIKGKSRECACCKSNMKRVMKNAKKALGKGKPCCK